MTSKIQSLKALVYLSLLVLLIPSGLMAREKANSGPLNVELNVAKLPAVSAESIMEAYGVSSSANGKQTIRAVENISKTNLLNYIPNMPAPLKKELIRLSACGAQKYEFISAPFGKDGKTVSVKYGCDSSCLATYEENSLDPLTNAYKLKGISDEIPLSLVFCETLWSGAIKVIKDAKDN